ncbi:MAG TPA: sulfate adenylyltransferase [Armatimonadota bacterium]|jgi:sulfate adenylyltransferase
MPDTIAPHGGTLVNRLASDAERAAFQKRVDALPSITLNPREWADLEMIAVGAFSPLTGFMGQADYTRVRDEMRLADGTVWSLPITLSTQPDVANTLETGQEIALKTPDGDVIGSLTLTEKYAYDKQDEARKVYATDDESHPGVAAVYRQGDILLAGPVTVYALPLHDQFPSHRATPAQTRARFTELGWKTVVGFQTRNPVHRAHEYLHKCALEMVDGLLLHPLVGETKSDDIPAEVRMKCYEALLAGYYPANRVQLSVLPAAMRYAGPREAITHALVRKNYGCTHFIVGRDHAGVGSYYGTYEAQQLFDRFTPEELSITPLKYEHTFYCKACGNMASSKTCPHTKEDHLILSGTKVRELLRNRETLPVEFTRPEVARVLMDASA